jgi:hypothetical protein
MVRNLLEPGTSELEEQPPILQSTQVFYDEDAERISNLIDEELKV